MTTYLGALYHGEHAMAVHRDGARCLGGDA